MSQFNPSARPNTKSTPANAIDDMGARGKQIAVLSWSCIAFLNIVFTLLIIAFAPGSNPLGIGLLIGATAFGFIYSAILVTLFSLSFKITGKLLNLGSHPHWVACGWLGGTIVANTLMFILLFVVLLLAGMIFASIGSQLKGEGGAGGASLMGCVCACFLLSLPILVSWKVTSIITQTSLAHTVVVTIIMWLKFFAFSIFMYFTTVILLLIFGTSIAAFLPKPLKNEKEPISLHSQNDPYGQQNRQPAPDPQIDEKTRLAQERQRMLDSLNPSARVFFLLGPQESTPKYTQALRRAISARTTLTSAEYTSEFTIYLEQAKDQRAILDACLFEEATELSALTFKTMLSQTPSGPQADEIISAYLFKPGLATPQIFRAAYKLNPTLALARFKDAPDKEPIVRELMTSITANDSNAPTLAKIALEAGDDKQREELYALALKPGTAPQTVQAIREYWSANNPDTLTDSLKLYFKIVESGETDPFDTQTVEALSAFDKPDRKVQKRIAAMLLDSYRQDPTPAKLKALVKWHTPETRRSISDALNAINSPAEAATKASDLRMAEELDIHDAIDHLTGIARTTPTNSDALLDYLRTDTLRVESIVIAALERAEFRLPESENDIRLMEEMGWKTARQRFADAYKAARTPADKKRFQDAEGKVQRYIATTLRVSPANNPDKPPFKPHSKPVVRPELASGSSAPAAGADPSLFTSDAPPGPKSLNAEPVAPKVSSIKIAPGDIVQISSVGATEFAIIAKIEPELITVTLIKNDKFDYIARERILKVMGTVDSPGLVEKLKAQMKGGAPATSPDTAKTADKQPAAAPEKEPAAPAAAAHPNKPAVGMKVEAKKFDEWHDATIEKIGHNQCYVTFDGKGGSWDAWLGLADLRPKGSKKTFMMLSLD